MLKTRTITLTEDETHKLIHTIISQDMARKADAVAMLQDKLLNIRKKEEKKDV